MSLWAAHIGDVLGPQMAGAGFAVTALLTALACFRMKEEELPRVALLSAAFFVASSIHVKLPPTSVHLLLNGLLGVLLGLRAPLAILCGITLQALLLGHGGISSIGVNAAVQSLAALAAWALYRLLRASTTPYLRSGMMALAALAWASSLLIGLGVLFAPAPGPSVPLEDRAASLASLESAWAFLRHPASLAFLALFTLAATWIPGSGEFAAGALCGTFSVLLTLLLLGAVLYLEGLEKWGRFIPLAFLAHLPLALLEGVIVGLAVAFLTRVKPELLGPLPSPASAAPG
jgi:cobalt/nickel transport system permease protein